MFELPLGRPAIMGILNVTPDSFSDGGRFLEPRAALHHAREMLAQGADIIDVGGESTRPGAVPVSAKEEIERVIPIIEKLAAKRIPVSVDTSKAEVAEAALLVGARIVNDVTALSDLNMAEVCARFRCTVCLMHMQGTPGTMQLAPTYDDVVLDVKTFLIERAAYAQSHGIEKEAIWIDPGIGFGKTTLHNVELTERLEELTELGFPVLYGASRKTFIGRLMGGEHDPAPPQERLEGTLLIQSEAQKNGARILRAHDVAPSVRAMKFTAGRMGLRKR
ncbi:MAG: dihydropteroate synthase [Armatimonadetes bacterium]|nr:dihydropteroate synthase [Armatimonadota bacterium]